MVKYIQFIAVLLSPTHKMTAALKKIYSTGKYSLSSIDCKKECIIICNSFCFHFDKFWFGDLRLFQIGVLIERIILIPLLCPPIHVFIPTILKHLKLWKSKVLNVMKFRLLSEKLFFLQLCSCFGACCDSPEVVQNKPYGEKADIWALGCLLYQMATLQPPFYSSNMLSLANMVAWICHIL